jgi:hypothetical protein
MMSDRRLRSGWQLQYLLLILLVGVGHAQRFGKLAVDALRW